jgi:integrase/recombinase XerD
VASVKLFPGCKLWYACFSIYTGQVNQKGRPLFKRVQRPTRLEDKSEALRLALSYEQAAKKAAAKMWHEIEAKNLVQQVSSLVGNNVSRVESADTFINGWLDSAARQADRKSDKTIRNYRGIIQDFLDFLGPRAERPVFEISKKVIIDFRENELKAGKASPTVNKALGVLKQAFDHAMSIDAMLANPVERGVVLPRDRRKSQKRRAFTFAQFKQLIAATDPKRQHRDGVALTPEWQTFIMLCGYTGGRQQEPAKLRWDQVDFKRAVLVLTRSKGNDEHLMPVHPSLLAHLKALPNKRVGYVMPAIAAEKGQALSKTFREIVLPRIGIVQEYHTRQSDPGKGVGRRLAAYSLHSLRHSLSTWLNEAGVSDATRMSLVGHEDEEVSRNYTHIELAHARKAIERIPNVD